jgi:prefoldin alpha subunit
MSAPTTTTTAEPQQINVADLDLPQLAEVKRQLEEVGAF